jgi:hypothetical protein
MEWHTDGRGKARQNPRTVEGERATLRAGVYGSFVYAAPSQSARPSCHLQAQVLPVFALPVRGKRLDHEHIAP